MATASVGMGAHPDIDRKRAVSVLIALALALALIGLPTEPAEAAGVTYLHQEDFTFGTYIIDKPGTYRLAEDISFDPNSPAALDAALASGAIPPAMAAAMDLTSPVDAYRAGLPLFTQFTTDPADFFPGGPMDPLYDPAGFGVGFFAAIAITADDVVLDLRGHTLEQSAEHALLQRFFAVIELADQPFVPGQGPASFGTELEAAHNVTIKNGTIGRSSHHGIHGNANANVTVSGIEFEGYEVGAVALNGVDGLHVRNVTATNRKDVPVLGTFSSARFIQAYVDWLVATSSTTTLTVDGVEMTAADVQADLRVAIDNTHHDIIVDPHVVDGYAQIDPTTHPDEYAVFHNPLGIIDGNSYSFLVNNLGVAVNGFPHVPDGVTRIPSKNISFTNVRVFDQEAFINEVPAVNAGGTAAIDPVGAVFQLRNLHPDTGQPITISDLDEDLAEYVGNPVANAQALVALAAENGDYDSSHLDITRMNIPSSVLDWVEGDSGSETLADIGVGWYCNGDSMFHVNKGVIAFKMDAAQGVRMVRTSVNGLVNLGQEGTSMCGEYLHGFSHPLATIYGYGGSTVRGYSFSGSENVIVTRSDARNLHSAEGPAIGFDIMTDSSRIHLSAATVRNIDAGVGTPLDGGATQQPMAIGFRVSDEASRVAIIRGCALGLDGDGGEWFVYDDGGNAAVVAACRANR